MDIDEFIEELLIAMDPPEDIDLIEETDLSKLEYFDSLAQLGIIVFFDTNFGINLTPEMLLANTIVKDLFQLTK